MTMIHIYTNDDGNEFALRCDGDQVMRVQSVLGINYAHHKEAHNITSQSDLAIIDKKIQEALALHIDCVDNCDENTEFECCNCLGVIQHNELHCEVVLYSGDDEICMVAAMHNFCINGRII